MLGPRVVNEFRGGFNRIWFTQDIDTPRRFAEFGIRGAVEAPEIKGLPIFDISGLSSLGTLLVGAGGIPSTIRVTGSGNIPLTKVGQTEIVSDTLSMMRGNHSLKFGAEVRWNLSNDFQA